jgi:hypothetical protein
MSAAVDDHRMAGGVDLPPSIEMTNGFLRVVEPAAGRTAAGSKSEKQHFTIILVVI